MFCGLVGSAIYSMIYERLNRSLFHLQQEAYVVTENYLAQSPDELTVAKNEYVFLVNRAKKNAAYYEVRLKDKTGLVPSKILKKTDLKVKRSSSFGWVI